MSASLFETEPGVGRPLANGHARIGDSPFFAPSARRESGLGAAPPWMALEWRESGQAMVHLPMLKAHQAAGFRYNLAGPNCALRWARTPAAHRGAVHVAVHLHGHALHDAMSLADKTATSGLDLDAPGAAGPILGLVPHGHAGGPYTRKYDGKKADSFDFPAIADGAALRRLVEAGLGALAKTLGAAPGALGAGRILLTAHSGGGAGATKLLKSLATEPGAIRGAHYFDATYGGAPVLTVANGWLDRVLARDAAAIARLTDEAARRRHMLAEGAGLRIAFLDKTETVAAAREIDAFIARRLDALPPDPVLRAWLRRYHRAQCVIRPQAIGHGQIPRAFGGKLLADPADDLAGDVVDLRPTPARAHGFVGAFGETEVRLQAPPRPAGAPGGRAFIQRIRALKGVERERLIHEQLTAGNLPDFLRTLAPVRLVASDLDGREHEVEYYVTRDYLMIGSDEDAVRIPMDPVIAQSVADRFGALLPTAQMVDQIYAAARVTLPPETRAYAWKNPAAQDAPESYLEHSEALDRHLASRAGGSRAQLVAGHKKDLVITTGYTNAKGAPKLAFYGWYDAHGVPVQASPVDPAKRRTQPVRRGLPVLAHEPWYVDYAHGVRLVAPRMKVDGREMGVAEVLRHPVLWRLLAREAPIADPRYTLDRQGNRRAPGAAAFGAACLAEGLGYGATWDARLCASIDGLLAEFMALPVRIAGAAVNVHPPYLMNVPSIGNASQCPATAPNVTVSRLCTALRNRAAAPAALRTLINGLPNRVRVGKGTPKEIRDFLQAALDAGHVRTALGLARDPTAADCRDFLIRYGIGVDCSGLVAQALNRLAAEVGIADRLDVGNTNSAALKGSAAGFTTVASPAELRPGDTMHLPGHIRILSRAERRGGNIHFKTAESRAGSGTIASPGHVGPADAYWRLVPDTKAKARQFVGWRLETAGGFDAPEADWRAVTTQAHTYGHWNPLVAGLRAAGVAPVALEAFEKEDYAGELAATLDAARVGPIIEEVLKAHSAIPVTHLANGARVTLGAHTPYVINRASSPSYKRAAQKRPALLARPAIKRVYDALPTAAKVGKAESEHVRAMLQGALDAGAVPGQGPGLTEAMLKDFLSDLGVGVDCSASSARR
jgi:hypothetical protein